MIKVQHWKSYATHYYDDDDMLGIGLELKKLQFKYSNYEGKGVPVLTEILDTCQSHFSQYLFPYLYDRTRMEDYKSALPIERLQFKYSNYEGMGVPVLTEILDTCRSHFSQYLFPYLYDRTRMEDYKSALPIERTGCCVTKMEYATATDIGKNIVIVSFFISFFD
jgi:hypothetical protein